MTFFKNPVCFSHKIIKEFVKNGDTVIDATCGNGNDTLFLSNLVGEKGKVYGFDIQEIALLNTKEKLSQNSFSNYTLILDGHENMDKYIENTVKAVMFNFGYLPKGDHKISTTPQKSIAAIEKALNLICPNGVITLVIYSGKDTGFDEKEVILEFLNKIDSKKYTVTTHSYINRQNNPPILALIEKNSWQIINIII